MPIYITVQLYNIGSDELVHLSDTPNDENKHDRRTVKQIHTAQHIVFLSFSRI